MVETRVAQTSEIALSSVAVGGIPGPWYPLRTSIVMPSNVNLTAVSTKMFPEVNTSVAAALAFAMLLPKRCE